MIYMAYDTYDLCLYDLRSLQCMLYLYNYISYIYIYIYMMYHVDKL